MANLKASLSVEKTRITDMKEEPALFLGFELRTNISKKLQLTKSQKGRSLKRVAGTEVTAWPDKQRLISRLHMKGYCDKKGFPKEQGWLIKLEATSIIDRFNAVLTGMANFYGGYIKHNSSMARWLYIVRYSCLKTLCAKYNTRIAKLFKRFGVYTKNGQTIAVSVTHNFDIDNKKKFLRKTWTLKTYKELVNNPAYGARKLNSEKKFNSIEYGHKLPQYTNIDKKVPSITDVDFLKKIKWVNLRTHSSFDLCCSLCGSPNKVEMHHINHIRKNSYKDLPTGQPWLKTMFLRNRRQIPVCRTCHMDKIHAGKYSGKSLRLIAPLIVETDKGYDSRLVNIESYLKPGKEYFSKTLKEKGWKEINN